MNTTKKTIASAAVHHLTDGPAKRIRSESIALAELAAQVRRDALIARAMLRTLIFACQAQEDQSMVYANDSACRWSPVVSDIATRLSTVRDVLINTLGLPHADWATPLTTVEALDAALWYQSSAPGDDEEYLSAFEVLTVAQTVVDMLDVLVGDLGSGTVKSSNDSAAV